MVYTKVWNGLQVPSERQDTSKSLFSLRQYPTNIGLEFPPEQLAFVNTTLPLLPACGAPYHTSLSLQQSTFMRGARVVFVR